MCDLQSLTAAWVAERLPKRAADSNKGSFGRVVALAGSMRYRGAAALCVEGALRGGAGLVYLAAPEAVLQLVLTRTPECCALPCAADAAGEILPASAAKVCAKVRNEHTVLLIGPGLGSGAAGMLRHLLPLGWPGTVLDADALNALATGLAVPLPERCILTPHPGEMARLLGCTVEEVQADRPAAVRACAEKFGCVAVLKDSGTLITAPNAPLLRNDTGNPGLARGGSGDVLAGLIAALLAQGLTPLDAAACGVYLHGAAADVCAAKTHPMTMLPQDLFAALPDVLRGLP